MRTNNKECHNSKKGHQGFIKKYQALGDTKHIRVPVSIIKKVKHILALLEFVAYEKGVDKVNNILDKVIEGLEDMQ
jgi:hypothetical protein